MMEKDHLFTLAPERVQFEEFWVEIRARNFWLIMLRYATVGIMTLAIMGIYLAEYFFKGFHVNTFPLWIINSVILLYNVIIHRLWHYHPKLQERFPSLHGLYLALLQICLDLISLGALIYFLGGVDTPLYGFFIFHVIIGSLFLTGKLIRAIVSMILVLTITGAVLELAGIIPHHPIEGLLKFTLYDNPFFISIFFSFFGTMLFLSIYFANSIARELTIQEHNLSIANKKLAKAEEAKSKYVMSVVHDLKTPIAAAINYLNLLLDGSLGDIKSQQQRPIERSKLRLTGAIKMINDILHISRLQLESGFEKVEDINLIRLFDEIYNDFRQMMNIKKIQYFFEADPGENIIVQGEPKLLKLALSNILSNAMKYTENDGEIVVKINEERDKAIISIADTGIGIPENEQKKIFTEFYRSSVSKEKGIEGTGLGMSIVLNIIQKHHGDINLKSPSYLRINDSKPGTEFIVSIPKVYAEN